MFIHLDREKGSHLKATAVEVFTSTLNRDSLVIAFHDHPGGHFNRTQARILRNEIDAFLGEKCQRCAANAHLLYEHRGLTDANEALRRDNADLTVQKDRLIAEAETLRQRVASLEKNNADLTIKWNDLVEDEERLREENARLKVRLRNARSDMSTITIGDWSRKR